MIKETEYSNNVHIWMKFNNMKIKIIQKPVTREVGVWLLFVGSLVLVAFGGLIFGF